MTDKFFWYDLMTPDPEAAAQFYRQVIGWDTQVAGTAEQQYTLFTVQGQGVAGLLPPGKEQRTDDFQPFWTGYIAVNDVDSAVGQLVQAGGKVLFPTREIPATIRFAVVTDPQGACFILARGLVEYPPPPLPPGTPGTVGWHELYADDWQTALPFYQQQFGWQRDRAHDMGTMGTYQLFSTGAAATGGMMTRPPFIPHACWQFYFNVPGIDAAATAATRHGGKLLNGPMQVPDGQWVVQCSDPQGAFFCLVAPRH